MKIRTAASLFVESDSLQTKKIETAKLQHDPKQCGLTEESVITTLEALCCGNQVFLDGSKLRRRLADAVHVGARVKQLTGPSGKITPNEVMV